MSRPVDRPVTGTSIAAPVRPPAVAGSFYPASPDRLASDVSRLLAAADRLPGVADRDGAGMPAGILVPHAGLAYSGITAAAAWARLAGEPGPLPGSPQPAGSAGEPLTVVLLGTNHGAIWLDGIAAWSPGAWRTPLGDVAVDDDLATAVTRLGAPFLVDLQAHEMEHSIEVQLPLLQAVAPTARILPLSVSCGRGAWAMDAGRLLGTLLAQRHAAGQRVVLAVSSDMAHYPAAAGCANVTAALLPSILAVDPAALADAEASLRDAHVRGLACGMCGIEPAVVGLAALRAMGAMHALRLAASTSADAGGPVDRTVGYLAVRFDR